MKFTAQEEYGLRCVLVLARARSEDADVETAHTVAEIAESEGISVQYVSKLFRVLGKAAVVESVRGCKGGYRLARSAQEITVAEILFALGGAIYEKDTCERFTGDRMFCVHTSDCSIRSLWSGLQHMVARVLSRVTLSELVGGERSMMQWIQVHTEDIGVLQTGLETEGREGPSQHATE
jgi:Rrf2 family protein